MKIEFDGKVYQFDKDAISVDEWRELKRKYKMTPKQFDESIGEADPDGSTFLYWVMLRQAGDTRTPLNDDLKPDIIALNHAVARAAEAEAKAEAAAAEEAEDPTLAASLQDGVTRPGSGSTTGTSASSATSISSPSPGSADSAEMTSGG